MRASSPFIVSARFRPTAVFFAVAVILLLTSTACVQLDNSTSSGRYYYKVQLWDDTGPNSLNPNAPRQNIPVQIQIKGVTIGEGVTDSQGIAILDVPGTYNGQVAFIIVDDGFIPTFTHTIIIGRETQSPVYIAYTNDNRRRRVASLPQPTQPPPPPTESPPNIITPTPGEVAQAIIHLGGQSEGQDNSPPPNQPVPTVTLPTQPHPDSPRLITPTTDPYMGMSGWGGQDAPVPFQDTQINNDPCILETFDDENTARNWSLGTRNHMDSILTNSIVDGRFQQVAEFKNGISRVRTKIPCQMRPHDMRIELDIFFPNDIQESATTTSVLHFLHVDDANYYAMGIQDNGEVWLGKMVRGQWQLLSSSASDPTNIRYYAGTANHLKIEIRKPYLYAYVNDQLVATIQDHNLHQDAQLWLGIQGSPGAERVVEIDNVHVVTIAP